MSKTHWKKTFNYKYLGSQDIEYKGKLTLTIKSVGSEQVEGQGGRKTTCIVAHFEEGVKPMILNKTNCRVISSIYSTPYIEDWPGKKITVFVKEGVEAFGAIVDALRVQKVRESRVNKKPSELTPENKRMWERAVIGMTKDLTIEKLRKYVVISDENVDKLIDAAGELINNQVNPEHED